MPIPAFQRFDCGSSNFIKAFILLLAGHLISCVPINSVLEPVGMNTESKLGIIVPALVSVFLVLVAIFPSAHEYLLSLFDETVAEAEVETQLIFCSDDNARFEYQISFLVGCASNNYLLKDSFIDIEILVGKNLHILGVPTRFDCSKLPDPVCSELHLILKTISKVHNITAIRANHNQKDAIIFLYDYVLKDKKAKLIEVCQVNQYITFKPTIIRGKRFRGAAEQSLGMYPQVPITLTYNELAIIFSFGTMLNGLVIMLFEYYNLYCFNKLQEGSMFRSLEDVAVSTVLSAILMTFVYISFKFFLKKKALEAEYASYITGDQQWSLFCNVFLRMCCILTIIMAVPVIFMGLKITFVKSLYWICGLMIATVSMIGICCLIEQFVNRQVSNVKMLNLSSIGDKNCKTVYFEALKTKSLMKSPMNDDQLFLVGPKMFHPVQIAQGKQKVKYMKKRDSLSPAKAQPRLKMGTIKLSKGTSRGSNKRSI